MSEGEEREMKGGGAFEEIMVVNFLILFENYKLIDPRVSTKHKHKKFKKKENPNPRHITTKFLKSSHKQKLLK